MGSNGARFAVLAVAIAAVVALFVILSGEEEDPSTTVATTTTAPAAEKPEKEQPDKPKPKPEPEIPVVQVEGGQPVGGVQQLEFESGGRVLFRVTADADSEFHLHGYDVEQSVAAGKETTFDLPADIEGVFELEDHATGGLLAEVTVSPG